jgi:hypothetical protein
MHKTTDKTRQEEIIVRNITNRNITPLNDNGNGIEFSFHYKLYLLKNCTNKIGVLVNAFKEWHTEAPIEDFRAIGGRIAGILKTMNNDYGYLLEIMWLSVPRSPNGSHLSYIQKIIYNKQQKDKQKVNQTQPIRNIITAEQKRIDDEKYNKEWKERMSKKKQGIVND